MEPWPPFLLVVNILKFHADLAKFVDASAFVFKNIDVGVNNTVLAYHRHW